MKPSLSGGFISAIAGIAITIWSYLGAPLWTAWPAVVLVGWIDRTITFSEQTLFVRGVIIVAAIILNVAVWGAIMRAVIFAITRVRGRHLR